MPRKGPGLSTSKAEVARRKELYVQAYAQTGNMEAALLAAGYSQGSIRNQQKLIAADSGLQSRAREARDRVVAEQADTFKRQQLAIKAQADTAIRTLAEIAAGPQRGADGALDKSWSHGAIARVQAATAILDRAGHKPIERVQQEIAWADVGRELAGVDVKSVLVEALDAIEHKPGP